MSQNRPDLIKRFVGVASNIIAHKILIKAELEEDLREYYNKEIKRDIDIALKYRDKINPVNRLLPQRDSKEIRDSILSKVKAELLKRVDKGYNADMSKIDGEIDNFLKEQNVG